MVYHLKKLNLTQDFGLKVGFSLKLINKGRYLII